MSSMNLIEIFQEVETITDRKLDKEKAYFKNKKVLPSGINIAGIDTTRSGENLTHAEFKMHRNKVKELDRDREVLRVAVAKWDALVMPKALFDELRKSLGLFAIYPSPYENWYVVPKKWRKKHDAIIDDAEQYLSISHKEKNTFKTWIYLAFCIVLFIGLVRYQNAGSTFSAILQFVAIVLPSFYFGLKFLHTKQKKWKNKIEAHKSLRQIFTDYTIRPESEAATIRAVNGKAKDKVQISLPQPPKKVLNTMIELWNTIPLGNGFEVLTIADELSVGHTIKEREKPKPVPVQLSSEHDPGLVVEYGTYVAIIPSTFYNVTALEESFLHRAVRVAEHWDARRYILN